MVPFRRKKLPKYPMETPGEKREREQRARREKIERIKSEGTAKMKSLGRGAGRVGVKVAKAVKAAQSRPFRGKVRRFKRKFATDVRREFDLGGAIGEPRDFVGDVGSFGFPSGAPPVRRRRRRSRRRQPQVIMVPVPSPRSLPAKRRKRRRRAQVDPIADILGF